MFDSLLQDPARLVFFTLICQLVVFAWVVHAARGPLAADADAPKPTRWRDFLTPQKLRALAATQACGFSLVVIFLLASLTWQLSLSEIKRIPENDAQRFAEFLKSGDLPKPAVVEAQEQGQGAQ